VSASLTDTKIVWWRNVVGTGCVGRLRNILGALMARGARREPGGESDALPSSPSPHHPGGPSEFPCTGWVYHPSLKRPSKRMANWAFAMPRSRGGIFHSFCICLKTRNKSLNALSSVGKCPRARTARRNLAFSASMALVVLT
jgi:hypothetical protein